MAVRELNTLATSVGVATVSVKASKWKKVERLIGILEGRCQEPQLHTALRAAAEKWVNNGGKLSYGLAPAAAATVRDEAESVIPFHKVLVKGFRLETHASMFTYNSNLFSPETWPAFETWCRDLAKRLGARAWAACLEESLHAATATRKYHLHSYLYWQGGDGLIRRNTEDLVFQTVAPRVDVCTRTNPMRLRNAALQGLYYVYLLKLGTVASASNYLPWRDYTPKPDWLNAWWSAKTTTTKS